MRDLLFGNDYGWLQHELPVPLGHFAPCLAVAFGVSGANYSCSAPHPRVGRVVSGMIRPVYPGKNWVKDD
jgi:hypothetical protein